MKKQYNLTYTIAAIAAVLFFIFFSYVQSGGQNAFAATVTSTYYEQSNVLDDLEGSTIDGKPFSLEEYNFDNTKSTQLLSFIEFGYSYYSNMQHDYGLYVYVYNPQGIDYVTNSSLNKISLRFNGDKSVSPVKYNLQFLNQSTAEGTEGLFLKYKIALSEAQRKNILNAVNSDERVYEVSEIELQPKNSSAVAYGVACTYKYSGYAEGYGAATEHDSTLSCTVDGLQDKIDLDVKHTVYRPQGDYYEGKQSQLNSCYFRIPEKYFTDYGELSKIACEWYEYVTQPILVTESAYLYQQLFALHGDDVSNFNPRMNFIIYSWSNTDTNWLGSSAEGLGWASNHTQFDDRYYFPLANGLNDLWTKSNWQEGRFDNFAAVFYAGDNSSYKNRYVSAEELTEQLLANSKVLGEPYINEKYSEALFSEYVNPYHTRGRNLKEIKPDDTFDIFWNITTKSAWQEIFGGYDVETIYDTMNAIVTISESDLKGTNAEISKRLYVSENDVADLKAEFKKCNNERLVLFRFGESDYYSIPCTESYYSADTKDIDKALVKDMLQKCAKGNYSAYIAQETVYLGFDIISFYFTKDNVEVCIPVISSPQDVISGLQPPLKEDYHATFTKTLKIVLIVIAVVVAVVAIVLLILWIRSKVTTSKKE